MTTLGAAQALRSGDRKPKTNGAKNPRPLDQPACHLLERVD